MARERKGWIEELRTGGYRIRWHDPVMSKLSGRRIMPSEVVHGTKAEARKRLRAKIVAGDRQQVTARDRRTLSALLANWLTARRLSRRIRESTLRSYTEIVRLYIDKHPIGQMALGDLTADALTLHYDALMSPRGAKARAVSPRVIRYVHTLVKAALRTAVKRDELAKNVGDHVELPAVQRTETRWLTRDEVAALLQAARAMDADEKSAYRPLSALLQLMVTTGLRPGEALALRWDDLTTDGLLRVRQNLVWTPRKGEKDSYKFTPVKTQRSNRTLQLGPSTLAALRTHKAHQNREKLRVGSAYVDLGLIFATELGTPLDRRNVGGRYFRAVLKRASLPETVRLYDLRHSCASALYADTRDPKKVASVLGHTDIRTTLNTYVHDSDSVQEGVAARLEEMFAVSGA